MEHLVSVIIPNRNGAATIGKCLEAALASRYGNFEVIVVDDASADDSIGVIERFACKLVRLARHAGAARARNIGAGHSRGEILFFTDADCVLEPDALATAAGALKEAGPDTLVGGTYTRMPYDGRFFSVFQSVFVHYSETRRTPPDYLATHALAVAARTFRESGGFREDFLPILEDVEFSHRLRRRGLRLRMHPGVLVRHIFDYSLARSLANAFRKARYWTVYSIRHGDLLADSGTASRGLKVAVLAWALGVPLALAAAAAGQPFLLAGATGALALGLYANGGLIRTFYRARGAGFALAAALYYFLVYPAAVGAGAAAGLLRYPRLATGR
jgi:glycosyltransferase involved in cell wall biosynthesis